MSIVERVARFAHAVVIGLAGLVLLAGCASPPQAAPPAKPPLHGALLVVRLAGLLEPPAAVRIDIALQGQPAGTSVAGRLQQGVPGQYADYLVALALPPDRYVMTAVRNAVSPPSGKEPSQALATMNVPFEVKPSDPVYLGRLVLVPGAASVVVQDHFDEDTVLFRLAINDLRTADIGRDIIPAEALAGSVVAPDPAVPPPPPAGSALKVAPVTEAASESLTSPSARTAFKDFLLLKSPRAFATSEGGDYGYARGASAVDRALRSCARRSKDETCRLFVVDETLITGDSCGATLEGGRKDAKIEPGCAPGSERRP